MVGDLEAGDVVVQLADRSSAVTLAAIHRESAHTAFTDIFPPEAAPPSWEEDLQSWERWLGPDWDNGRRAYVARIGPNAVGVVLAGPDPDEPATGHLARLYVLPARWGDGVGRLLYHHAMSDLTERGFSEATLWVLEANARARRWYERLGWSLTGRRKPVYPPAGIDDVQYRIDLGRS